LKNIFYFCFIFITAETISAKTWYYLRFEISQTRSVNQDSFYRFEMVYYNKTGEKRDTIEISGNQIVERNYVWNDNFRFHDLYFKVYDRKGNLLRYFEPGSGFDSYRCEGYNISNPFSGSQCADFSDVGLGALCGSLQFQFTGNETDSIYSNFYGPEKQHIYCELDSLNKNQALQLRTSCDFHYLQNANQIQWWQSADGIHNWTLIDSGGIFYPSKSASLSPEMFGEKRFYKAIVKKNFVKNVFNYTSEIYGPVTFWLRAHSDSLRLYPNKKCHEKNQLVFYWNKEKYKNDSAFPAARLEFLDSESLSETQYQIEALYDAATDIIGLTATTLGIPAQIPYRKGRYIVECNFTPWTSDTHNTSRDTIFANDDDSGYFTGGLRLTKPVSCFQFSDAELQPFSESSDSAIFRYSLDGLNYYDSNHIFSGLPAGKFSYFMQRADGCTFKGKITISQPPKFFVSAPQDTTLCNGQSMEVCMAHPLATEYQFFRNGKEISDDSWMHLNDSGIYTLIWEDKNGCIASDSFRISKINKNIRHDFLVPAVAFSGDTIVAVVVSNPKPDSWIWKSDPPVSAFVNDAWNTEFICADTGIVTLELFGKYGECGFKKSKSVQIIAPNDTAKKQYVFPKNIRIFSVFPNPNNGKDFRILVQLNQKSDFQISCLNPITGKEIALKEFTNLQQAEGSWFDLNSENGGIYYLRLQVNKEIKTLKIVTFTN